MFINFKLQKNKGMALLAVLFTVAFVSLLLLNFSESGKRKIAEMQLWQIDMQASFYARGAEIVAIRAMRDHNIRILPIFWSTIRGEPAIYPSDLGSVSIWVKDLQNCFNVNALASNNSSDNSLAKTQFEMFSMRSDFPINAIPGFTAKLKDWLDRDSEPEFAGGAEGLDYVSLTPKRLTADQPMADISEINFIDPLDEFRYSQLNGLCAYPSTERILLNLNTLSARDKPLIYTIFDDVGTIEEGIDAKTIMTILAKRPEAGWENYDELKTTLKFTDKQITELRKYTTLMGKWFGIYSKIDINGMNYYFSRIVYVGNKGDKPRYGASSVKIMSRSNSITSVDYWPITAK